MNILVPLAFLSLAAFFAGLYLSRRRQERTERFLAHYAPNPEPVVQAQPAAYDVVAQAEAVLEAVLRRERR